MAGDQVNVLGWYGKDNAGDESYKLAFPKLYPDLQFTFGDNAVGRDGAALLGGGDVVTPEALSALRKFEGRKTLFSVTVSDDRPKELFRGVSNIVVRDLKSFIRMRKLGLPVVYAPDVAHVLTPDPLAGRRFLVEHFKRERLDLYGHVVAVVLNSNLVHDTTARQHVAFEKLTFDIGYVSDYTPASFVFLPFGMQFPWDDRAACGVAATRCKFWKKNAVVWERLGVQGTLNLISACDAVISTRLHSTIFATVAGVPFVDVIHNHKNPEYLKSIGKMDWAIPFLTFDAEKCKAILHGHLGNPEARKSIAAIGNKQQDLVRRASQYVRLV